MAAPVRLSCRLLALSALLLFCALPDARAHRVYIFAWAEGGQICTESYFSKKAKITGGSVLMLDAEGRELARGVSDATGTLCFAPPEQAQDLLFVVEAGEGHKGDFLLPAAQAAEAVAAAGSAEKTAVARQEPAQPAAAAPTASPTASGDGPEVSPDVPPNVPEETLRRIVREEVSAQLAPLRKDLARLSGGGSPGPREIVGGLGWIAGLAALAVLFKRKKER